MPVPLQEHPPASSSAIDRHGLLAVCGLGVGCCREIPRLVGGYEYLLVAIDKFSKWVEVKLVIALTAQALVKFI
jgi:hypothetical protein